MPSPNHLGDLLVVEDNPGDVRLIKEMLKEEGLNATVHDVSEGAAAVDFLYQRGEYSDAPRPDMVLLDLHLPRMDGDEVLAEVDGVVDVPVVALSGSQRGADLKLDDIKEKVDACQVKPLEPDVLRELGRQYEQDL